MTETKYTFKFCEHIFQAIVGGGRSVITYDQKYEAKTFQNVELSLEKGLSCDHANQEEKDGRKRCDDYSIGTFNFLFIM